MKLPHTMNLAPTSTKGGTRRVCSSHCEAESFDNNAVAVTEHAAIDASKPNADQSLPPTATTLFDLWSELPFTTTDQDETADPVRVGRGRVVRY
jgi:hypothetical protein